MEPQAVRNEILSHGVPLSANRTAIRRRILIVSPTMQQADSGGPDVSYLAARLGREGHSVSLFACHRTGRQNGFAAKTSPCVTLPGWRTMRDLYRKVVRHDLVYLQATPPLELAYSILPALLMAKFFGKQIIISFAGGNVEDLNGKISRFLTPMLRLADKIIVPTEWSARLLARHHLPVEVVPTLVESGSETVRLIQEVQPRILSFLLAGPESNLTTILRAARLAKQKYPRLELRLVGSSEKLRTAEPVASQEGLVRLVDASNLDQVSKCWKECDLLVHNSTDDDLPTPVLRALTLGIPVISCDAGGMTAVIQHGQSGLIFPANDPVALAGRIIDLIEQPHLVTQLSRSGPAEAYRFEWPSVRGRWISLFNRYSN